MEHLLEEGGGKSRQLLDSLLTWFIKEPYWQPAAMLQDRQQDLVPHSACGHYKSTGKRPYFCNSCSSFCYHTAMGTPGGAVFVTGGIASLAAGTAPQEQLEDPLFLWWQQQWEQLPLVP